MGTNVRVITSAVVASLAAMTGPAAAFEQGYPGFVQPSGVFLNTVASDPPPGIYGGIVGYDIDAKLTGPGTPLFGPQPVKVQVAAIVPTFLYVSNFKILGGDYSAVIAQPLAHTALSNPVNQDASGLHNTIIFPINLSYKFGDSLYVKPSFGLSVPTGTIDGPAGLGNNGNPFFTFLPRLVVTYSTPAFNISVNAVGEINTANYITNYRSGSNVRVEALISKTFGRFTIGPAFTYLAQVGKDTSSAFYNFNVHVNRYDVEAVGALIGYDFGPVSLSVYGTQDVHQSVSGGFPVPPLRVADSATFPRGFRFFTQLNFRLPGQDAPKEPSIPVVARY